MAHTQGVKVPGVPGSGKRVADGKGVSREAESEGSRRRNLGPRNTNRIRRAQGVRLPNKPKPNSCTEPAGGGAGGVDGMGVAELPAWLEANHGALTDMNGNAKLEELGWASFTKRYLQVSC